MRRCPLCGGELEERTVTHPQEYKGRIIIPMKIPSDASGPPRKARYFHTLLCPDARGTWTILENVPAEVCRQCGAVLLCPDVLERVQELVWSETTPKCTASVPVYDLAEVS